MPKKRICDAYVQTAREEMKKLFIVEQPKQEKKYSSEYCSNQHSKGNKDYS
jgi:hypothetical protein